MSNIICRGCGNAGHMARDCTSRDYGLSLICQNCGSSKYSNWIVGFCDNFVNEVFSSQSRFSSFTYQPTVYYCQVTSCASDSYCSNHNKYCQHSSCYNRIASYQSSCFDCQEKNQLKTLVKQRTNIAGDIQEVERFTTWWNNNLATVIVYDNSHYRVFLLVYVKEDNSVKVFPHDGSSNYWGEHSRKQHNCLSDAKSET